MQRIGFRVAEFAEAAGISRAMAYELLKSGRLKAVKLGKATIIPANEAAMFIDGLEPYRPQSAA